MKPIGWAVGTGLVALAVAASFTVAGAWPFTDENDHPTFAPLLERVTPAVVNVAVASAAPQVPQNPLLDDPFFRRFFDLPEEFQQPPIPQQGVGSGVIIDAERGLIVSNSHVVQNEIGRASCRERVEISVDDVSVQKTDQIEHTDSR